MTRVAPRSRLLIALGLAPLAALAAYAVVLVAGPEEAEPFFGVYVFNGLVLAAALLALARAVAIPAERAIWAIAGIALACWAASELHFSIFLADDEWTPFPSLGDWLFLAFFALIYVALVTMARLRIRDFHGSLWLDGLIAFLGVSAAVAAIAAPHVSSEGLDTLGAAVNTAYVVADVVLFGLVAGVFAVTGWRPGRRWLLAALGLVLLGTADVLFLVLSARGAYAEGSLVDALWPAATLALAYAAWQPIPARRAVAVEGARLLVLPCLVAPLALAVLSAGSFTELAPAATVLAIAALAAVIARLALTLRENQRRLAASRRDALIDPLTGIGNRRRLMADLEQEIALASRDHPGVLLLFDLDGFKGYNDRFGHPAGDALLERLGERLEAAVDGRGSAYRLGGDEFCVLVPAGSADADLTESAALEALSEAGPGYGVAASSGRVCFPLEATTFSQVMAVADARLYDDKAERRASRSAEPSP